jgi:tetratricopeptide (TPR) repeat protein
MTCPGAHGLWSAIGGTGPAFRDAAQFASIHAAFAELPPDLRTLVGPGLVARLLDAGETEAARLIHDTTTRPDQPRTSALTIVGARLAAAEGDPQAGIRGLSALIEANSAEVPEALIPLVRLSIDAGLALPERHVTDLRAAALQARGTARAADLRLLLAEALAGRNDLVEAIAEIRSALIDLPGDPRFSELAVAVLAAAEPELVGRAVYAETVLANTTLISAKPANDAARQAIARRLVDLGLPQTARDMIEPAAGRDDGAARLLLAETWLRTRDAEKARGILAGLEGPEAARLTAEALALDGAYAEAGALLRDAGLPEDADGYAWSSGDWSHARGEAAPDAERKAMAEFMVAQTTPEEVRPASPDPATLGATEAFVEPLPALERPSLDAARRLLATGRQVEGFVQALLDETAPAGTPAAN